MADMSHFMGVFRAQGPDDRRRVTKRNRQPVSCAPCRQKKLKCDRQQPCGACVKRGEASVCEFGASTGAALTRSKEKGKSEAQLRLQKLEEMVNGLIRSKGEPAPDASNTGDVQEGMRNLDVSNPERTSAGYYLSSKDTEVSFVGATHWSAVLEGIHDLKGCLEGDTGFVLLPDDVDSGLTLTPDTYAPSVSSASSAPSPSAPVKIDMALGQFEPLTIKAAIDALPERAYVENLLALYFTNKFFAVPFLHSGKFQREYNAFRANPESTSLMWISVLFSVLCISSGILIASGKSKEWPQHAIDTKRFMHKAGQAIVTGEYVRAQPFVIEAMLLHTHSKFLRSIDSEPSLWAVAGLAVRLAQKLGMHRDPARLTKIGGTAITPFQAEMRRRMWFHCETFDLMMSFQLGMPPIITDNECDIGPPRNILNTDFDEDSAELPPERPSTEDSPMLFAAFKSRFIRLFRKVLKHALSTRQPAYSETMAIDGELHRLHENMPALLRIRPIHEVPFTDSTTDIMKKLMLETLYRKALVVLHRNYLTFEKTNPAFDFSRQTAIDASMRLLDLQEEYHRETKPGGRIYEERWMMSNITLHDFLMSAMIICLDLSELPQTSQAAKERKINALRNSHRIWSEKRSVSRDADHATNVLSAMLAKAFVQSTPKLTTTEVSMAEKAGSTDASVDQSSVALANGASNGNGSGNMPPPPSALADSPPLTDESFEFMDLDSLDEMLSNTENLDWNAVDQYLRDLGHDNQPQAGQLNFQTGCN